MAKKNRKNRHNNKSLLKISMSLLVGKIVIVAWVNLTIFVLSIVGLIVLHFDPEIWSKTFVESDLVKILGIINGLFGAVTTFLFIFIAVSPEFRKANSKKVQKVTSSIIVTVMIIGSFLSFHYSMSETENTLNEDCYDFNQVDITPVVEVENAEVSVLVAGFDHASDTADPQVNWSSTLREAANDIGGVQVDKYHGTFDTPTQAHLAAKCLNYTMIIYGEVIPSMSEEGGINTFFIFNLPDSTFATETIDGNQYTINRVEMDQIVIQGDGAGVYTLHFIQALVAYSKQDYERTLLEIELAKAYAPEDLEQQKELGLQALCVLQAIIYSSEPGYENQNPMPILEQAIQIDPLYTWSYLIQGFVYMQEGNMDRALDSLNQTIELDPDSSSAYHGKCVILTWQENYQQAIANCQQALELDPDNSTIFVHYGDIYLNTGEYHIAIAYYDETIRLDSNLAAAYVNRSVAKSMIGDNQGSLNDIQQAILLIPNEANVYINLGSIYAEMGEYNQSILAYSHAIQLDPTSVLAYSNRSLAYNKINNQDLAISDCTTALRINPNFLLAYLNCGIAYYSKGDYRNSLSYYRIYLATIQEQGYSDHQAESRVAEMETLIGE